MKNNTDPTGQPAAGNVVHESPVAAAGFTQIPNVVLTDHTLTCEARLIYGYLKHLAWCGHDANRETLASALGFGVKKVTAACRLLQERGLLDVQRRGLGLPNLYVVREPETDRSRKAVAAVQEEPQGPFPLSLEDGSLQDTDSAGAPDADDTAALAVRVVDLGRVDRQAVDPAHNVLAQDVLALWNQLTEQSLTSKDWLRMLVMRIREHPELTLADHEHVLRASLASPWWRGAPSPNVIYGSGAQFERSMTAARNGPAAPARRYGTGMTTAEILAATQGDATGPAGDATRQVIDQ